ncbi:MAG: indole-3-glycerol phosphate synthase TrpC [Treponemataceae bacterium]|nr:MAG: indole-3-glycerol phosphate synthase TrpC [Treponemataceae bacterium]
MILERITAAAKIRLEKENDTGFPFERALRKRESEKRESNKSGLSFICEVKKASPSKGIIAHDFPYMEIAKEYEHAGAAAISVLTEPEFFLGKNEYLSQIAHNVSIPVLRKDFIIDERQIYEAKFLGASAVLLICAILPLETLAAFIALAHKLGISALVEVHDEEETQNALESGARIIGINNRNLKDFSVDISVTERLKKHIPAGLITISESGIATAADIKRITDCGVDAVLIGESMMRAKNKAQFLAELCRS